MRRRHSLRLSLRPASSRRQGSTFRRVFTFVAAAAETSMLIASSPQSPVQLVKTHCDKIRYSVERPPLPHVTAKTSMLIASSPRLRLSLCAQPAHDDKDRHFVEVPPSPRGCGDFVACCIVTPVSVSPSIAPPLPYESAETSIPFMSLLQPPSPFSCCL